MNKFEGEFANFVIAAAEAHKPEFLAAIASAEGGVEALIVNAVKNAPKGNGAVALLFPLVENELIAFVHSYVAKYGPEVVYDFLDSEARGFAKRFGG